MKSSMSGTLSLDSHSSRTLGEELLNRLTEFRGKRHNDEETLLVLQREIEPSLTSA